MYICTVSLFSSVVPTEVSETMVNTTQSPPRPSCQDCDKIIPPIFVLVVLSGGAGIGSVIMIR